MSDHDQGTTLEPPHYKPLTGPAYQGYTLLMEPGQAFFFFFAQYVGSCVFGCDSACLTYGFFFSEAANEDGRAFRDGATFGRLWSDPGVSPQRRAASSGWIIRASADLPINILVYIYGSVCV